VDRSAGDRTAAERRLVARRRRVAVGLVAALAAVAGLIVGAGSGDDGGGGAETDGEAATPPPPPACPTEIASSLRRLAGAAVMVRMEDIATDELLALARAGELGGVILFPSTGVAAGALGDEVSRLRRAARGAGFPEPLVAIDQEGGEVKRLPDEPPETAPSTIAASRSAATARAEGLATGEALARIGIDVDLAPVLDLGLEGSFVASRSFGADPGQVAELGLEFADGLGEAGLAATAKHFPGLGLAVANTDLGPSVVEATREEMAPGLRPFRRASEAAIPAIMVSNAIYTAYDAERPATLSPKVVRGLLRRDSGYDGVVVTDDLGAGAITQYGLDEGDAAVAATRAGADVLLFALSDGSAARAALVTAARRDDSIRSALRGACARLTALRARLVSRTGAR
jgi:beta-N-acetylhexosaminidase